MYTNGKPAGVIAKFIDFMLSKEGQKIVNEVKYVSIKVNSRGKVFPSVLKTGFRWMII